MIERIAVICDLNVVYGGFLLNKVRERSSLPASTNVGKLKITLASIVRWVTFITLTRISANIVRCFVLYFVYKEEFKLERNLQNFCLLFCLKVLVVS